MKAETRRNYWQQARRTKLCKLLWAHKRESLMAYSCQCWWHFASELCPVQQFVTRRFWIVSRSTDGDTSLLNRVPFNSWWHIASEWCPVQQFVTHRFWIVSRSIVCDTSLLNGVLFNSLWHVASESCPFQRLTHCKELGKKFHSQESNHYFLLYSYTRKTSHNVPRWDHGCPHAMTAMQILSDYFMILTFLFLL